jgi:diguanylate cyclase (GGDEF)-like protein
MKYHATHDDLTQLANRREFSAQLKAMFGERRTHENHALLFIDLDQFKIINDTCGHAAGDKLLKDVATLLGEAVRSSDSVARLGGDEFAVLLRGIKNIEYAESIARKIIQSINHYQFCWFEKLFQIGASVGIVLLDDNVHACSDALAMADNACYVAKDQGRNRYYVYKKDDETLLRRNGETNWIQKVKHALAHDELLLYCQPVVNLRSGSTEPDHMEMLLRLSEDDEVHEPAAFIPAAERYQTMPMVDRWVVENTCKFLANPRNTLPKKSKVSINISGQTLVDVGFVDFAMEKLQQYAISAERIIFEITETAAIANYKNAKRIIKRLKKIGCAFSLDDFGSGMSSFSYLKSLPVDFLKIDGSFVKGIAENQDDCAMVQAIRQIGQSMNIKTIAEFAEDQKIIDKLLELDIELAQGYALGKPVPAKHYLSNPLRSAG